MANQQRDPARERFWRDAVSAWQSGGLSVRAFCRQRQVPEASFYAWRRELQRREEQSPAASPPAFVPMTIVASPTVEVRCPSGHVVTLPHADIERLRQLFAALATVPPC